MKRVSLISAGVLGVLLLAGAGSSHAQPAPAKQARLAADEQRLWIVLIDRDSSTPLARGLTGAFQPGAALNGPVADLVATAGLLFVRVGKSTYSLRGDRWTPELNLPPAADLIHLTGYDHWLYALVTSPRTGEVPALPALSAEPAARPATPPASQPFDPGDAAFSVLRYEGHAWVGVAPAPPELPAGISQEHARIAAFDDDVWVLWLDERRIASARFVFADGAWHANPALALPDTPDRFWFTVVGRTPLLITASAAPTPELHAARLAAAEGGASWRPLTLHLSELPAGVTPVAYHAAAGFNQHLALLLTGSDRQEYVQFARTDAPPAEPTLAVQTLIAGQHVGAAPRSLQVLTLLLLFGILATLFIFRREALVRVLELPAEYSVALTFHRLIALLIDALPFLWIAAAVTGVEWRAGLSEVFGWAARGDALSTSLPGSRTLLWWMYTSLGYCTYCLVLELLTRRTLGKLVTGTRVLSESGREATALQILTRNALRFVELQPPLWIMAFLVILSRNRQRVGDILARTIIVRRVRPEPPETE